MLAIPHIVVSRSTKLTVCFPSRNEKLIFRVLSSGNSSRALLITSQVIWPSGWHPLGVPKFPFTFLPVAGQTEADFQWNYLLVNKKLYQAFRNRCVYFWRTLFNQRWRTLSIEITITVKLVTALVRTHTVKTRETVWISTLSRINHNVGKCLIRKKFYCSKKKIKTIVKLKQMKNGVPRGREIFIHSLRFVFKFTIMLKFIL